MALKKIVILFVVMLHITGVAQKTTIYTDPQRAYADAVDLYDKEKFTAAQHKFQEYIGAKVSHDESKLMHANYYVAICAKELYHENSEFLLKEFVHDFPESPRVQSAFFNLGVIYYRKKRFEDAIEWFDKVDKFQLNEAELSEYYFKKGYSHFQLVQYPKASKAFREIKDVKSQYQNPAIYYYSHIAYEDKNYQTALEGFNLLRNVKGFDRIVPYYITQIYFAQKKYQDVVDYGAPLLDSAKPQKQGEIANMVGDSYYRMKKYDEAIPYLVMHANLSSTTLEEKYRLGFCFYSSGEFDKATKQFGSVSRVKDELGQNALYYMGHAYVALDLKSYAQNAYEEAAEMDFDKEIQEDALFRYAQLAYELSLNPYDKAIEAFQKYLTTYPNSPRADDAYQYLINVYMTTRNYKAAIESLEKIQMDDIRLQKAYQMVVFNRAVELYSNVEYDGAIKHFKKVKTYPIDRKLNAESLYWLGECYFTKGNWNEARFYYNKFIKAPGSLQMELFGVAHYNIAYTYLKDESYTKAIEEFRQYVARPDKDEARLTDAYLRIADAYFTSTSEKPADDRRAIEFYGKALSVNYKEQDYALFQRGISYGYLKQYKDKVVELKKLLSSYNASKYIVATKYQIGEAYRLQNEYLNAIKYYTMVSEQHSNNQLATPALLHLGHMYLEIDKLDESIDSYTAVLQNNPSKRDCREAVYGLKDVYVKKDQLEKWETIVSNYGCVDANKFTLDSLFFAESVNKYYLEDNCEKIKINVDRYLERYPTGYYKTHALYYKAECLFAEDKADEALPYYEQILEQPQNEYSEIAFMRTANAYYKIGRIQDAFTNYSNLEKLASNAERLLVSRIGQMRCFYKLGDYSYAKDYAEKVIRDDQTPEQIKVQAQLIIGMSHFNMQQWDQAIDELSKVNKMTTSIYGAEAKYHIAFVYFKKQDHEEVENQILELIQQKPSYSYWMAKGYILLSDNLRAQGDFFQAKHTLQSIIDNYTSSDPADDIISTAKRKLQEIIDLENTEEEGKESRSMELDLGGDEDVIKEKKDKNQPEEDGGINE